MTPNSNAPKFIQEVKIELVGSFSDRRNATEFKRLLSIGCVYNSLASIEGRIIEKSGMFHVYAYVKEKVLLNI